MKKSILNLPRSLALTLAMMFLSGCNTLQTGESNSPIKVATVTPVIASMAEELTENTNVEVSFLPAAKYNMRRVPGWLNRQSLESYPKVDVAIGVASVWPEVDVYPALRTQNVGVIPVDLAEALVPKGEKVAMLIKEPGQPRGYFWLNPANSLIMLGILQRDLIAILELKGSDSAIQDIEMIRTNFASMSESLRHSQVKFDTLLLNSDVMQVTVAQNELDELAAATLLPIVSYEDVLEGTTPSMLITNRRAGHRSLNNIPAHIIPWSVDDFSRYQDVKYTERWASNIATLAEIIK